MVIAPRSDKRGQLAPTVQVAAAPRATTRGVAPIGPKQRPRRAQLRYGTTSAGGWPDGPTRPGEPLQRRPVGRHFPEVDQFLRELDAALARMTDPDRADAVAALRLLVQAAPGLRFLRIVGRGAVRGLLQSMLVSMATDSTPQAWLSKLARRAEVIAPHVAALFRTVS